MSGKISRTYKFADGGLGWGTDDMWYDEWEETFYEGDTCPQCNKGKLKVSRNNKLYCSETCWLPKARHEETLGSALDEDEDEDMHFDALNDEEWSAH